VEFIDGVRLVAEMEADKDSPLLNDIRIHFSRFIHRLITNTPGNKVENIVHMPGILYTLQSAAICLCCPKIAPFPLFLTAGHV